MAIKNETLITPTADIVGAHVSYGSLTVADVSDLIENVYGALAKLGAPAKVVKKVQGVVSIRASINPEYLISIIDGKHYKMLKRHLKLHGYTPESERARSACPTISR